MGALETLFGADGWGGLLLRGAMATISLALLSAPLGFGGGLVLAFARRARLRVVRAVATAYATFFRGIPDLLALFIVYFGLQALLDRLGSAVGLSARIEVSAFLAAAIALAAVTAAYSAEVWLGALRAVPPGQSEAAAALGLRPGRVFLSVVGPQLLRIALPGLGNLWTLLLKETSLVSTLAVLDLMRAAAEAARATRDPLLFYGAAAAGYLMLTIASGTVQTWLERRAARAYAA